MLGTLQQQEWPWQAISDQGALLGAGLDPQFSFPRVEVDQGAREPRMSGVLGAAGLFEACGRIGSISAFLKELKPLPFLLP